MSPSDALITKLPLISVTVPMVFPLRTTVTPGNREEDFISFTTPFTTTASLGILSDAVAVTPVNDKKQMKSKKSL